MSEPVSWRVCNYTPASWNATIEAWASEYHFDDGDTETVSSRSANLSAGQCGSGRGHKTKCLVRAHVVMTVVDKSGKHLFDKWVEAADFKTVCPDEHTSTLGKANLSSSIEEFIGEDVLFTIGTMPDEGDNSSLTGSEKAESM